VLRCRSGHSGNLRSLTLGRKYPKYQRERLDPLCEEGNKEGFRKDGKLARTEVAKLIDWIIDHTASSQPPPELEWFSTLPTGPDFNIWVPLCNPGSPVASKILFMRAYYSLRPWKGSAMMLLPSRYITLRGTERPGILYRLVCVETQADVS
jgi:hypothetical protein